MRLVVSRPWKDAASALRTVVFRLRMMLVTIIALTCVSCSLFPKKELSGTADERPKAAQNILTSLSTVNSSLDVLYTSVSRGLDAAVLESLEYFIVEAAAKKSERQQQAELVKTGLEILVDLKATKIDSVAFAQAIYALRQTIILFDIEALRYLQDVGRLPVPQSLALSGQLLQINNSLARGLFTLSIVVRRAALEPQNGTLPELRPETRNQLQQIQTRLTQLKTETFLGLQSYLAEALFLPAQIDASVNSDFKQTDFALSALNNSILLAKALQAQKDAGQIDRNALLNSIKAWTSDLKVASAAVVSGTSVPALPTIPETAPKLDPGNGSLPDGAADWSFTLVENPTQGVVDLKTNPPVYRPSSPASFSIDRYTFRACFKIVPTFCTANFSVVVQSPLKPESVGVKTAQGVSNFFSRGDELVCTASLQGNNQTPVYRWSLVGLRNEGGAIQSKQFDVTSWEISPGRLKVPNMRTAPNGSDLDVRAGDKIRCEVKARLSNGLESAFTAPTLASMTASNSAPSDISLASGVLGFEEQVQVNGETSLPSPAPKVSIYVDDIDGAVFDLVDPADPGKGPHVSEIRIEGCAGRPTCPFILQTQAVLSPGGRYTADIQQTQPVNYEANPHFDVTITAVDKGGKQLTKVVRIPVIDRNDPVTALSIPTTTEVENKIFSQTLSVVDEDCSLSNACQNTGYTYQVLSGLDSSYFEIDGRILKSRAALDFENKDGGASIKTQYTVNVRATDARGGSRDEEITVSVTNENEPPACIKFEKSGSTQTNCPSDNSSPAVSLAVSENATESSVVATLETIDPDTDIAGSADANQSNYTYNLTMLGNHPAHFKISGRNIIPNSAHPIDFEMTPTLSFMLTSTDPGGKMVTVSHVTVLVLDVNESPSGVSFSQNQNLTSKSIEGRDPDNISNTSPNSVLRLYGVDPDDANNATPTESFTFEITEINGSPYDVNNTTLFPFAVVGQDLHPRRVLNYSTLGDREWNLKVRVKDQDNAVSPETNLVVRLFDINFKTGSEATIVEGESARAIGDLCVANGNTPDCSNAWSYSLVSSPQKDFFAIGTGGTELSTLMPLDFETFPGITYTPLGSPSPQAGYFYLKVRAVNTAAALSFTQQIKINLNNTNERPGQIQFTVNGTLDLVDGQSPSDPNNPNDILGYFTTTDQDLGDGAYWRFDPRSTVSPDSQYFELISPVGGDKKRANLRIKQTLPAGRSQFTVAVRVEDDGSLEPQSGGKAVTFNVLSYPVVELNSNIPPSGRFNRGLHEIESVPLQVEIKARNVTESDICVKSTGNIPGVHIEALTNASAVVLDDSGITVAKKSGGTETICTLTLTPVAGLTGEVSFNIRLKSERAAGLILPSQSVASVPVTFWRKPELRCPQRISLPVGTPLDNLECKIHFSDGSVSVSNDRSSESISFSGCDINATSGKFSGGAVMPAAQCDATVSVSGVSNRFTDSLPIASQTLSLVPKKFSTNGLVYATAKDTNGDLYLGGAFTAVNPIPALGATAVRVSDAARAAECNLTEGFNGPVHAVLYDSDDESFLVGGEFTRYRAQNASRLVRLSCSGEPVSWFSSQAFDGAVRALARAADGTILVGGSFTKYGTADSAGLVRLNANGALRTAYVSAGVNKMSITDSSEGAYALSLSPTSPQTLWVGGRFSSYESNSIYSSLVRVNIDTGENLLTVSPGIDAAVYALDAVPGGVYVGGEFANPGLALTKLTDAGAKDNAFNAGSTFTDTPVRSLLVNGSGLFVGATSKVVKMDATTGSLDNTFGGDGIVDLTHSNPNVLPSSYALALVGADLIVGGRFTAVDATPHFNLAKLNSASGAVVTSFNSGPGLNDAVRSVALYNSNASLLLGGEFSTLGGASARRLARFSSAGQFNSVFNARLGSGFNADVRAILFSQNDLLVAGAFTEFNGSPRGRIVRLTDISNPDDTVSLVDADFLSEPGFNGEVRSLALAPDNSGKIFVGGSFSAYKNSPTAPLVRLDEFASVDTTFALATGFSAQPGRSVSIHSVAVSPAVNSAYSVFVGGDFRIFRNTISPNLVKMSHTGARDASFAVGSSGFDQPVHALLLTDTTLFVGGAFSTYKGAVAEGLVSVNASTASPIAQASLAGGEVRALQLDSAGKIWAGGSFNSVTGVTAGPLVRLEPASLDLVLEGGATAASAASLLGGTVLGPHAPDEWLSIGAGHQYNGGVFGIHSLLFASEIVNSSPVSRLYLGGFFSLLKGLTGNSSVRVDLSGNEAPAP